VKRTDDTFIYDILIAADSVRDYVRGVTRETFLSKSDAMVQDAVIRQVGIIGEAASKLSPSFRATHPTVPWGQIIGMRNIVIHQYWEVNLDVVWAAATQDVPALAKKLSAALSGGGVRERFVSDRPTRTRSRKR
jgi:uncharacterized protein with HEPN domain